RAGRRDAHRPPLGGSARRAAEDLRGLRPAHHVDPGTGQPRPGARSPVQLPPQSAGRRLHTAGPYPRGPAARARSNDMITDFPAEPLPPPSPGDATAERPVFIGGCGKSHHTREEIVRRRIRAVSGCAPGSTELSLPTRLAGV